MAVYGNVNASQAKNASAKQMEGGSHQTQASKKIAELQSRLSEAEGGAMQVQDEINKAMDQRLNNR
jgi:hypothetical protein